MPSIINRFVLLPSYINLKKEGLHYRDLLIYLTIRSFNNIETDLCIPSYDTISERSGMSKKFVSGSLKRLEKSSYLEIDRSDRRKVSNRYSFKKTQAFSRIPYEIFKVDDLTATQKAMLITLRQCFDSGSLELMYDLQTVCQLLDMTYRTVYPLYIALIKLGYIEKRIKVYKSGRKRVVVTLTEKVNWHYNLPQINLRTDKKQVTFLKVVDGFLEF